MIYGALDLGVDTGFAFGPVGAAPPRSGFVRLKRRGEDQTIAFSNMIAWLWSEWTPPRGRAPAVLAFEAPMRLEAFVRVRSSEDNVLMHFGLRAVVLGMCGRFGVKPIPAHRTTVLKHFTGRGNWKREEGKAACLARARQLGYMRKNQFSQDQADALATWDWVCQTCGKHVPEVLHLWGAVP